MNLYHFSEDPSITTFHPRAVDGTRPPGREWLNAPLVWAIDAWHAPAYLFPRECPRILWWPLPTTAQADLDRYWERRGCRMVANIEWAWSTRLATTALYRYTFAADSFVSIEDHGVHVSREAVTPLNVERVPDLLAALREADIELRLLPSLLPLRHMWGTTLHVSGIRLRNAAHWETGETPLTANS
ncbi:MAG: DUF6886 family protein [Dehalococcoidia bacterium]